MVTIETWIEERLPFDTVERYVRSVPSYWDFTLHRGTPEFVQPVPPEWGNWPREMWEGFMVSMRPGTLYLFNGDHLSTDARGVTTSGIGVSVMIRSEDPPNTCILRIWHELLHDAGMDSDVMEKWIENMKSPVAALILGLLPVIPGLRPVMERRFYTYLTARLERDETGT